MIRYRFTCTRTQILLFLFKFYRTEQNRTLSNKDQKPTGLLTCRCPPSVLLKRLMQTANNGVPDPLIYEEETRMYHTRSVYVSDKAMIEVRMVHWHNGHWLSLVSGRYGTASLPTTSASVRHTSAGSHSYFFSPSKTGFSKLRNFL